MWDRLAAMGAVVDHYTEAFGEVEFLCDCSGRQEEMTEKGLVIGVSLSDTRDQFFGNDQHMDRGLRLHIMKGDAVFILVGDIGRDLAVDDFLKDGFRHVVFRVLNVEIRKKGRNGNYH